MDSSSESNDEESSLLIRLKIWIKFEAVVVRLESRSWHEGRQKVDSVIWREAGREMSR